MRICQRVFALLFCCCLLFSMFLSAVPVAASASTVEGQAEEEVSKNIFETIKSFFQSFKNFIEGIDFAAEFENIKTAIKDLPTNLKTFFDDLSVKLQDLPDDLKTYFEDLGDKLKELPSNLKNYFDDLGTKLKNLPQNVGTWINNAASRFEEAIKNIVKPAIDAVAKRVEDAIHFDVFSYINNLKNNISVFFDDIGLKITGIPSSIKQFFDDLGTKIKNIPTDLKQFFDDLGTKIKDLASALGLPTWLSDLKESVSSSFIVTTFQRFSEWFQGVFSFFESPSTFIAGVKTSFINFLQGTTGSEDDLWNWVYDTDFQYYINQFFSSISMIWLAFPLAVRYLILIGFGFPFLLGIIKIFAR